MEIEDKLLLKPEMFKPTFRGWRIEGVLNPGAVRMENGKILLMVRVAESAASHKRKGAITCPMIASKEDFKISYQKVGNDEIFRKTENGEVFLKDGTCRLTHMSHFKRVILSKDGFNVERITNTPNWTGKPGEGEFGVEDPRIVKIGKKYYMTYVGVSLKEGISTYLAESKDLIKWHRLGLIFREQNKDAMLFPGKIGGEFVALNRPESAFHPSKPSIWIAYSKDLIYWGRGSSLIRPREDSWESSRIGGGCPPVKTNKGWLEIYHGMRESRRHRYYSAGALLLGKRNPEKIIARSSSKKPLFLPDKDYEKRGFVNNVIFPTGIVWDKVGVSLLIYSGGGDSVVSVRRVLLKDVWSHLGL